ncbi:taste receptor type 2 member 140-like [Sphaerodactylus townsendi]|uniref:taste receptor type 2 member 140-like n=1 Tax=Sphaerodactylus townsendi TaxID=933632 RepID=UPI002026157B|nr:taste receptor type 2 member 140-like [Sphaerodactylus townsendi]
MANSLWITGFAFLIIEIFAGMIANGSIVLINSIDWFRRKKLSLIDLILICLGFSRLMGETTVILHIIMNSFFLHIYVLSNVHVMCFTMWLFTHNAALWLAAWLSILYFIKIATFSNLVFLQLKQKFTGLAPWLLLISVVFSSFMIIIVITEFNIGRYFCALYKSYLNNSCDSETETVPSPRYLGIAVTVPNFIPFVIFISSVILLIISLWKHIRHLRHNGIEVGDLNTNVHLTAIKALASFAVMFLFSFVAITFQTMLSWSSNDPFQGSLVFYLVYSMYPPVHGVILILINRKLKQAWVSIMQHLKRLLSKTPS